MTTENTKDILDLGSVPPDDFDPFAPFATEAELKTDSPVAEPEQPESPAEEATAESSAEAPADAPDDAPAEPDSANPLESAIGQVEDKAAEKAKEGLLEKLPVFEYAGASEDIEDVSKTFDELRIEKAADFPELDDGKRVSWSVEYGKITKAVSNPKGTSIGKLKAEIETSKEFLDALRKAKDKNPACKVKPRVTAQSKGLASYKGIFRSLEEAESSDKHIRILPARDGHVYEMRCTEAGRFLARADNVRELSEVSAGFIPAFPPVPFALFTQVLAFFRHHMRDGRETEVMAYIYWDKEESRHVIRVPMQTVSKAHISVVVPTEETIDFDRYIHIADIHSHNSMPAFFSDTDDQDEQATRVYIVVGLLHKDKPAIDARISVGGRFVRIDVRQVIDIPSVSSRDGVRPPFYDCQYFSYPDNDADFPLEWLSMVNISRSIPFCPSMNIDIPTLLPLRMSLIGRLRSFRLRKGA